MNVAKVTEITAESPESFEHALKVGVERASKTLQNVTGVWIKEQKARVEDGRIIAYRVDMKVTFLLKE